MVAAAPEMMVQRTDESLSFVKSLLLMSAMSMVGTEWKNVHFSLSISSRIVPVLMLLGKYRVEPAIAFAKRPATGCVTSALNGLFSRFTIVLASLPTAVCAGGVDE